MDLISLMEVIAAGFCMGLLIDYRKEPEKYGIFTAGLNRVLYAGLIAFILSVLYGVMLWMPCQGIATFVRGISAATIGVITGSVLKKHKKTLHDDVQRQLVMVAIFTVACAADVLIAALGI